MIRVIKNRSSKIKNPTDKDFLRQIQIEKFDNGVFIRYEVIYNGEEQPLWPPVTSAVIVSHDGTSKFGVTGIDLPGFLGTKVNKPLGMNGGAGPTSFRPDTSDITDLPSIGCYYFDTDLGYSINWNGTIWVDSTGAPV